VKFPESTHLRSLVVAILTILLPLGLHTFMQLIKPGDSVRLRLLFELSPCP
jgi:hypothetical protein